MKDEIIIGKGEHVCMSIHVFKIKGEHNIAENSLYYTSHRCIFDTEIKIYKNTKEGKQLTKMIEEEKTIDQIKRFIDNLILKRINSDLISDYIKNEKEKSFDLGKRAKAKEITKALYIYDTY